MFSKTTVIAAIFVALFSVQGCSDADAGEVQPVAEETTLEQQ